MSAASVGTQTLTDFTNVGCRNRESHGVLSLQAEQSDPRTAPGAGRLLLRRPSLRPELAVLAMRIAPTV